MQPHVVAMSSTEHTLWITAIILGASWWWRSPRCSACSSIWSRSSTAGWSRSGTRCKAAAANTADTVLIPQVADGVEAVLAEGLQHHLFLGRVLGKVKS